MPESQGKTRICIRIDEDLVDYFLKEADKSGSAVGSQTRSMKSDESLISEFTCCPFGNQVTKRLKQGTNLSRTSLK
jgi:hypothetical protein